MRTRPRQRYFVSFFGNARVRAAAAERMVQALREALSEVWRPAWRQWLFKGSAWTLKQTWGKEPMVSNPNKPSVQQCDQLSQLQGEVHALKGVLAVLIAHISLLTRAPLAKREEILRNLTSMLPDALAQIEHDAPPAVAAGFERAIEGVTHMARNAVRIEPVMPAQPNSGSDR